MEIHEKAKKVQEKYENKLKIVEENVELTEAEKQIAYKKLHNQILKHKKNNIKMGSVKEYICNFSQQFAGDDAQNFLIGVAGGLSMAIGSIGIATGIISGSAILSSVASLGAVAGLAAITNTVSNISFGMESAVEDCATNNAYKTKDIDAVLDEFCEKLEALIKPNNVEITR